MNHVLKFFFSQLVFSTLCVCSVLGASDEILFSLGNDPVNTFYSTSSSFSLTTTGFSAIDQGSEILYGSASENQPYSVRLKSGGAISDSGMRTAILQFTESGRLAIAARSSSSSVARTITISQGGFTLYEGILSDSYAIDGVHSYIVVDVNVGAVDILTDGGVNFYYFGFEAGADIPESHYVYFTNPNEWSSVYCYIWNSAGELFGGWPGVEASFTANGYRVNMPLGETPDNTWMIIWNDGFGSQTGDMKYIDKATYDLYGVVGSNHQCGDNLTWSFDALSGMLTIDGFGETYDWGFPYSVPWFSFASSIRSVVLPEGITRIGNNAFYGCTNLTSITCEAVTPPTCDISCFYGVYRSIPIFVSCESIWAYKNASEWSEFTNILPIDNTCTFSNTWDAVVDGMLYGNVIAEAGVPTSVGNIENMTIKLYDGEYQWTVKGTLCSPFVGANGIVYKQCYIQGGTNGSSGSLLKNGSVSAHVELTPSVDGNAYIAAHYGHSKPIWLAEVPNDVIESGSFDYGNIASYIAPGYSEVRGNIKAYINSTGDGVSLTESMVDVYGVLPIPVRAGYTYLFWAEGSKLMLSAVSFIAGEPQPLDRITDDVYYTVTFEDDDHSILQSIDVLEGELPSFTGETLTKEDVDSLYIFAGWDKDIVTATEDVTYTATYTAMSIADLHRIYFTNPDDWSSVYCYIWNSNTSDSIFGSWPGKSATKVGEVYRAIIPLDAIPSDSWKIIWNDGGYGSQSGNLKYVDGAIYDLYGVVDDAKYCGEDLIWNLDAVSGTLSITGTGDMDAWTWEFSVPWYSQRAFITAATIAEGATNIGNQAFAYNPNLTSISIPSTVTSIGYYAFYGCSGLSSITCGATTPPTCGSSCFYNVDKSIPVYVPVGSIAAYRSAPGWRDFTNIQPMSLPNNVIIYTASEKLPEATYGNLFGLQTDAFNVSITSHTFSDGIGTITFSGDVTSIGHRAFFYCRGLTSVTIPNTVTSIGNAAFSDCPFLASFTIPENVTSIENGAFDNCSALTSITIPNSVTSIGAYVFRDCPSLATIIVESGNPNYDSRNNCNAIIETASNTLIAGCQNTVIPNSVTSIGDYAFYGCSALTSLIIPRFVMTIGNSAFRSCPSLTTIVIESGNPNYDSRNNCNAIIETASNTLIFGCQNTVIPNTVTSIGNYAFFRCTSLISLEIPNSVTSIGNWAFYDCSGLTSITIPNSVTSIGNYVFENCTSLISVTLPNSITSIGKYVFRSCSALTSFSIPSSVTSIGDYAFSYCSSLTSFILPSSVRSLGEGAFAHCSSITSVFIPKFLTSIGVSAFSQCPSLASIVVESGNTVYDSRDNCNAIIQTATNTLFTGCQSTVIPSSVTSIRGYAFNGSSFSSIIIPNTINSIEYGAFYQCPNLVSITIPQSVTSIEQYTFYECSSLASITIPQSVASIGAFVFYGCSSLTSITCEATTPPTCKGSSWFYNVDKSIPLYVPCGSVDAYRAAVGWSEFTNIQPMPPTRLEIPVTADQWHYIAFPVDVDGADIEYAGNGTWGYYNSTLRATGVSGWQNVDPATTPLNANQGYIFYGDQTGTLYVNIDPATLPSGDQSIMLTDYPSFHADNENWNFVGNPYNETYNVRNITPAEMNLYVWNGTGYYAKTAGHDNYDLQPLEAFFVQKKNTENSVDFAAASAGSAAPARAWATNSNRYIDIAAVAGSYTDYTRVVLNETASLDYTVGYDLAKFFSSEAPIQLFTLDAQSVECGVQELPNGVEEIALGYTVLESGEVVVSATDMDETYYLYDAETGITTDLRQSSYTFTAEAGTTVNRLSLRHTPATPTDLEHVDGVNKYVNTPTKLLRDGQVLILRGEKVYDLRGQEIR